MREYCSLPPGQLVWGRPSRNRTDDVRLSDDQFKIATPSTC
jgi:hypothetical protein